MRDHEPSDGTGPLHQMLQRWNVSQPLPPRFETRVWQRIKSANARPAPVFTLIAQWIEQALDRPVLAVAYVSILLVIGLTLGDWQAHLQSARAENAARALYVQAVDPYQAPRR